MQVIATLVVLALACGQLQARRPYLDRDCRNGITPAKECCARVPNAWFAHLKNPTNCGQFYHCAHGIPVLKDCPSGLHWSVRRQRCEWPRIARCTENPTTAAPTTAAPTTAAPTTAAPTTAAPTTAAPTTSAPTTAAPTTAAPTTSAPTTRPLPAGCYDGSIDAETCCTGVSAWYVHLPDPLDCGKFYQCDNGKAVHKDCPANLHWSVVADRCEWPENTTCNAPAPSTASPSTSAPTTDAPTTAVPTTAAPTTAAPTTAAPTTAAPATTERPTTAAPTRPTLPAGCYDGSLTAEVCCKGITDWWTHLPDPANCGRFYQCDNGKAVQKDCPAGLHWSIAADRCEWPEIAKCKETASTTVAPTTAAPTTAAPTTAAPTTAAPTTAAPTTTERPTTAAPTRPILPAGCYDGSLTAEVCCKGITDWWTHLPDPANCGRFYQCDNGKAVQKDCPAGLHWSIAADRCEWPDIADCKVTAPTTAAPTTAAPTTAAPTTAAPTTAAPTTAAPTTATPTSAAPTTAAPTTAAPTTTESPTTAVPTRPTLPAGCYDGSLTAEECCEGITDWWTHLPDPENCGRFYQCDNGKAVQKDCPENLHWSIAADRCEWPEIAKCKSSGSTASPTKGPTDPSTRAPTTTAKPETAAPTTPEEAATISTARPTRPPRPLIPKACLSGKISAARCCRRIPSRIHILLPNTTDCTRFIQCDNGKAVDKHCPFPLHFNVRRQVCDWPRRARCKASYTPIPLMMER